MKAKCSLINCTHNVNNLCTKEEIEITDHEISDGNGREIEFQICESFEWKNKKPSQIIDVPF